MRKGNQLYGDGNLYETPFRNYDPRLGRWLSPDPIQHPWQGSYTAFNNNPIYLAIKCWKRYLRLVGGNRILSLAKN
jgi:uncharacterized protein RhaS with RHS repeats